MAFCGASTRGPRRSSLTSLCATGKPSTARVRRRGVTKARASVCVSAAAVNASIARRLISPVIRERASDDERRVIVSLTAEGRDLRRLARAVPRQLAQATGCSADELTALTTRLQQLRSQLQGVAAPEH